MKNNLYSLQKVISLNNANLANTILEATNNYINGFEQRDFLGFSGSKEKLKKYEEDFVAFLLKISPTLSELRNSNADLASLIIKADKLMEAELVVICEKQFLAFEELEKKLYEYTSTTEESLSNAKATASSLVNAAQKFKIALLKFISENS